MQLSNFVTLVVTVPETDAHEVREAMGQAGAGKVGNYSFCSFSVKGIGRFMPLKGAHPHIGKIGVLKEVVEERIETCCSVEKLDHVIEEIRKVHPYEEPSIDVYPVYEIRKTSK